MQFSIVNYSKLDSRNFRLEAEFYTADKIVDTSTLFGEEIIDFVQYGTSKELNEDNRGYPVLRLNEYEGYFIKEPTKYCEKIDFETYSSLKLQSGDVMICRTNGNPKLVGKSAIVMEDSEYAFASYLYRIRPKQDIISSATLMIYLNSHYGRGEIEKYLMVSNQANFSPAKFREIKVPVFGKLNDKINTLVKSSYDSLKTSKKFYSQAERVLLDELGLSNWRAEHRLSFIKNYSETEQAGRFDAEYFQPKYEKIVKAIKRYKGGWDTLGNLVNLKANNFKPKDKQQYKYIELADIAGNGEITDCMIEEGQDLPSRARRKVATGDIIVSSIEGSLSSIAMIEKEYHQALCSTGFHVVNSDDINSETLLVLLKSQVGQEQLKKGCSGTILTAFNKDELGKIILPMVDKKVQADIQRKITESFTLRKQSKHLLECAKKAVEMAIEKDEKTALQWLKNSKTIDNKII